MKKPLLFLNTKPARKAAPIALGDSWGVVGDSMTYGALRPKMYAYWLALEMAGRCRWLPTQNIGTSTCQGSSMGVSGDSTADIAARASYIQAAGLDVVFCFSFENDNSSVTAAEMIANWETVLSALSASKRVYMIGSGETRTVYASSTIQARNAVVNAWMATANQTYTNVSYIPDTIAWQNIALHNGAGGAGEDSTDGVHMNLQGAKKFAANLWSYVRSDFATGNAYDADPYATNLFPTDFSGTTGSISNATGAVATGMALTNTTGATLVASKGTLHGKNSQILTLSGTATANARIQLREYCANTFVIGDSLDGFGRIKVSASDGVSAPVGLRSIGFDGGGGRHIFLSQYHDNVSEGEWSSSFEGIFRIQPAFFTAGGSSFTTDLNIQPVIGVPLDIRVELADVKMYNMTQEGI